MCLTMCVYTFISVFLCVCVCVSVQWLLTLLCPDTPDEYLQDTGGEEQSRVRTVRYLGKLLYMCV